MAEYLITGAAGGMGSVLCGLLTEKGHRVWGIDRLPDKQADGWTYLPADITDTAALEAAYLEVRSRTDGLDGIIHMAGVYDLNSLAEMSEKDFIRDFDINLFGVFRVNKLFLPLLRKNGRVVIVSSELAPLDPLPFTGIYAVTKTALEQYASALRMELQLLGHKVIVIRPGAVKTGMLPASSEKLSRFCAETSLYAFSASRFQGIVDRIEARNVPPEKIADVACKALRTPHPRLVYCVNRNPLLLLFSALPKRLQLWIIRKLIL